MQLYKLFLLACSSMTAMLGSVLLYSASNPAYYDPTAVLFNMNRTIDAVIKIIAVLTIVMIYAYWIYIIEHPAKKKEITKR